MFHKMGIKTLIAATFSVVALFFALLTLMLHVWTWLMFQIITEI